MDNEFDNYTNGNSYEQNNNSYRHITYEEALKVRDLVEEGAYKQALNQAAQQKQNNTETPNQQGNAITNNYEFYRSGYRVDLSANNEYHSISYSEAQEMRDKVRQNAVRTVSEDPQKLDNSIMMRSMMLQSEADISRPSTAKDGWFIIIFLLIIGVVIMNFFSGIYTKAAKTAEETQFMIDTYAKVEGTITNVKRTNEAEDELFEIHPYETKWSVSYSYEYEGKTHTSTQSFDTIQANSLGYNTDDLVGNKITVYVNPENPNSSIISSYPKPGAFELIGMLLGLGFILFAAVLFKMFSDGKFTVVSIGYKKKIKFRNI